MIGVSDAYVAPFRPFVNRRIRFHATSLGNDLDQWLAHVEVHEDGDDVIITYLEGHPEYRFTLYPHLRVTCSPPVGDRDTPTEWEGPRPFVLLRSGVESLIQRRIDEPFGKRIFDGAINHESGILTPDVLQRKLRVLMKLVGATSSSVRRFINSFHFLGITWNLHQACRTSPAFRNWVKHHPQLTYLACANQPIGAFDGTDGEERLAWMVGGSFKRILECSGLPPVRGLASILKRIPPSQITRNLRRNLAAVANDPAALNSLLSLSSPIFPETVEVLARSRVPLSPKLLKSVQCIVETGRIATGKHPNEFGPFPCRIWNEELAPLALLNELCDRLPTGDVADLSRLMTQTHSLSSATRLLGLVEKGRLLNGIDFFEETRSITPLKTLGSLVRVSKSLRNCIRNRLGRYREAIQNRECQLFLVCRRRERALLQITNIRKNHWTVTQFKGKGNSRPSGRLYRTALRWAQSHRIEWRQVLPEE